MSSNRHDAAMCELLKDDPYKTTVFVGALHGIILNFVIQNKSELSLFFRYDDRICTCSNFFETIW